MDFVFKFVAYKLREFIRTNIFSGRFLGWRVWVLGGLRRLYEAFHREVFKIGLNLNSKFAVNLASMGCFSDRFVKN